MIMIMIQTPNGEAQEALIPPTAFTANILDTTSVRLEWKPIEDEKVDGKGEHFTIGREKTQTENACFQAGCSLETREENTYFPTDRMKESSLLQMANQIIRSESD